MGQTPRLEEIIENAINERLESFWTAIPAKIKSYDHATQRATISITVANAVKDGSGEKHWYHPTIPNVPVLFPGSTSAGDDYRITYPISSFSNGLYIVSSLPTDGWKLTDGNVELDIDKGVTNHLSSGFLIPADTKHSVSDAPTDAMVLWGKKVKVGGDASSPVATLQTLERFMTLLATAGAADTTGALTILYNQLHNDLVGGASGWPGNWVAKKGEAE